MIRVRQFKFKLFHTHKASVCHKRNSRNKKLKVLEMASYRIVMEYCELRLVSIARLFVVHVTQIRLPT